MPGKRRIAVIGLGMAVTPHARSLRRPRATGSRSPTPSAAAPRAGRRSPSASPSRSPTISAPIAGRRFDQRGDDPDPARRPIWSWWSASPPPASTSCWRSRSSARPRAPRRWCAAAESGRRQARRRVPAPLPRGLAGAPGTARGGRARRARRGQRRLPLVAAAELLRRARPRHARARRRRRADHPGDPHPRSRAEPDRPGRRGRGDLRHHRPASHGDRGLRRRRPALRQRRARRAVRDHRRVPGLPRADRADRHRARPRCSPPAWSRCTTTTAACERVGEEQATGGGADPMAFPHDAHRALLADFLDALDQDREPARLGPRGAAGAPLHRRRAALLGSSAAPSTIAA